MTTDAPAPVKLAFYDMDRTVTRTGTFTPFLLHAALALSPWRLLLAPLMLVNMARYGLKRITRGQLKELNGALILGPHRGQAELARAAASFAERTIRLNSHAEALDRIAADRADGYRLILATASYRLYVEAIAARLGFDDVIATGTLIGIDERVTTTIDGENCYGPAKLRMVVAWMEQAGLQRSAAQIRFYSDHVSDAPVLEWADEPFAVAPSAGLRRLARQRGWPILHWR